MRDRVLAPSELTSLAGALDGLETAHLFPVAAIKTAAVTGLRISKVLAMAWGHVDFETGRVVLPSTKTGRRVALLAAAVLELLAWLPRVHNSPCVFPSTAPVSHGTCRVARVVFAKACEAAGLVDIRLHDFRRSLTTQLTGTGMNAYLLRDVLGH